MSAPAAPAATPAPSDNKSVQLANIVADMVAAKVLPPLLEQIAALKSLDGAILARIEILESMNAGAGKKAVKATTSTAKTGTAKAVAKPAGAAKADNREREDKIANSMLWFKYCVAENAEESDFREVYCSGENLEKVSTDPTVVKCNAATEPVKYWNAVAAAVWKLLPQATQGDIKIHFTAWKNARAALAAAPPLAEEGADEVVDETA